MTNPANLLVELLKSWAIPAHKRPEQVRSNGDPGSEQFWRDHSIALNLLSDIERSLIAMEASGEDVSHYRATLPSWYQAVFTYTHPWASTSSEAIRPTLPDLNFRMLQALAGQISSIGWVPSVISSDIDSAAEAFTAAEQLVREDRALPSHLKRYLLGLIAEARLALDEYTSMGSVALRRITMELGGAMMTVSEMQSDSPARKRWSERAKAVLFSAVVIGGTKAIESGVELGVEVLG